MGHLIPTVNLKVAYFSPELQSLIRQTPLAEVAEQLPRSLMALNHQVVVFLPWTGDLDPTHLDDPTLVGEVVVPDGKSKARVRVHTTEVDGLSVVLLDHALFGDRNTYGTDEGPYPDNWRRFALYSRAALEAIALVEFKPDVIHCLDWATGLVPLIHHLEYETKRPEHPASRAGTLFGIHNLAIQGNFEREILPKIGIPVALFQHVEGIELGGKVNFLKAGAEFATVIAVPSPSQTERIQELDRGYGLEDTFKRRAKELVGVLSGIDYQSWNPAVDPLLASKFSATSPGGKKRCKAVLQSQLNLDSGPRTPVVSVIGRFETDEGFDILSEVLTNLLERNIEIVLMGSGRPEIIERLKSVEATFPGRTRVLEGYNINVAHVILGGADILMLPGHHHPSNALCSVAMRYGVVPLVYAGSELDDIVFDLEKDEEKGNGFLFNPYSGAGLVEAVDVARKSYKSAAGWKEIVQRCMELDLSWSGAAEEYVKAYRRVTRRARSQRNAS